MRILPLLTLGKALDRGKSKPGRFKPVAMEQVVPRFGCGGGTGYSRMDPALGVGSGHERTMDAMPNREFCSETDPVQLDNCKLRRSGEGRGITLLRRLIYGRQPRRRSGTLLMQHVTVIRNDLSVADLELVPAKPLGASRSLGWGGHLAGSSGWLRRWRGLFRIFHLFH